MMSSMKKTDPPSAADAPVVSEGGRSPSTLSTGRAPPAPAAAAPCMPAPQIGPLAPGQRRSVAREREVVLRLLRGESVELLSRELGVPLCGAGLSKAPHQHEDEDDDEGRPDHAHAAMAEAIAVAADKPAEAAEQRDDEDDEQDGADGHGRVPFVRPATPDCGGGVEDARVAARYRLERERCDWS